MPSPPKGSVSSCSTLLGSPPTATAHWHCRDQEGEKGKARSHQCGQQGDPTMPMPLLKGLQGTQETTVASHSSHSMWASSSEQPIERYHSSGHSTWARAGSALATLTAVWHLPTGTAPTSSLSHTRKQPQRGSHSDNIANRT